MGRIRSAALLAGLLAVAGLLLAQDVTFKVDVRLVRLLVTVKDAAGQLVSTLDKADFTVLDNGVPQSVSLFERQTSQPLSIALLVDTSGSTAKDIKYETESVERFFQAVFQKGNPEDSISLYSFNWEVQQQSSFTRSRDRLNSRLRQLRGEAGTSLYDALYFASRDLEAREGRHVVLVVTDGGDTTSAKTYQQAARALDRADVVLYSVVVVPITNNAGRNTGGENALHTLSTQTGGRTFAPTLGPDLDNAFTDILRDLRTQYLLAFYPQKLTPTRDPFHRIEIQLREPNLRASHRTGYYGEAVPGGASNIGSSGPRQ